MSKEPKYDPPLHCPRCGAAAHPDELRRAKVYGQMKWPCGRTYYIEPTQIVPDRAPVTGEFGSHLCTKTQLDQAKASNAEMFMALESVLAWYGEHSRFDTDVCMVASRIAVANARKLTPGQDVLDKKDESC